MYLTGRWVSDCLTSFCEPLSTPNRCHPGLKKCSTITHSLYVTDKVLWSLGGIAQCININYNGIIIKRISRAPVYRTRWEHRVLYNNANDIPTQTCVGWGDGHGCEKDSLEIVTEQVRLEGGFKTNKRGGRIRVFEANCSWCHNWYQAG